MTKSLDFKFTCLQSSHREAQLFERLSERDARLVADTSGGSCLESDVDVGSKKSARCDDDRLAADHFSALQKHSGDLDLLSLVAKDRLAVGAPQDNVVHLFGQDSEILGVEHQFLHVSFVQDSIDLRPVALKPRNLAHAKVKVIGWGGQGHRTHPDGRPSPQVEHLVVNARLVCFERQTSVSPKAQTECAHHVNIYLPQTMGQTPSRASISLIK